MELSASFLSFVEQEGLLDAKHRVLVTASGGLDSIVLSHLLYLKGQEMAIAHANFGLRGEESLRDEAFVQELALRYGCACFVKRFDTQKYASAHGVSVQVAARELRYGWFGELAEENKFDCIATAHHFDDTIETVIHHFFRGSGLSGLRGIPVRQGLIIRPLLFARRREIEEYALEKGLSWVEDSSNSKTDYTRNRIRLQLVPLLREIFPGFEQRMETSVSLYRELEELQEQSISMYRRKLVEQRGEEHWIAVEKLRLQRPLSTIMFALLQPFGFTQAQLPDAIGLMDSQTGRYLISPTHRLLKNRNWFVLTALQDDAPSRILIEEEQGKLLLEGRSLRWEMKSENPGELLIPADSNVAWIDARNIHFPLILRRWTKGDYFYPLGMRKKKKLARFFIDQKMSLAEKEATWVLECDKKIIWIAGRRIDERFKVTERTGKILKLNWQKK